MKKPVDNRSPLQYNRKRVICRRLSVKIALHHKMMTITELLTLQPGNSFAVLIPSAVPHFALICNRSGLTSISVTNLYRASIFLYLFYGLIVALGIYFVKHILYLNFYNVR